MNITQVTSDDPDMPWTAWEYDRVVTPDLSEASITAAVAEQFDSDPDVLAQALAHAR